ncbi:unnamed protein product [Jaminaea pallidilutea]
MISSLAWVKRGAAARHPSNFNISDDAELQRIQKLTNIEFGDAKQELQAAREAAESMGGEADEWDDEESASGKESEEEADVPQSTHDAPKDEPMDEQDADELAKYKLDTYDDEPSTGVAMGAFSNIKGLTFHRSNDEDPYITLKDVDDQEQAEEDRDALEIMPTDNMLISAKTEDEVSLLEAHVYTGSDQAENEGSSLYVHHDLLLPSFPLCLEWLNHTPASTVASTSTANPAESEPPKSRNFLAVSTMDSEIEIWNLDIIDGLVPEVVLGDREASKAWEKEARKKGTGKKKRKQAAVRPQSSQYHTDAVLSLSWNPSVPNLLASSSADHTIKLWDLDAAPAPSHDGKSQTGGLRAIRSFELHADKVQSVAWNTSGCSLPSELQSAASARSILASGGYDGYVKVWDVRQPASVASIKVSGEIEKIRWNPWRLNNLVIALDNGLVASYEVIPPGSAGNATNEWQINRRWTLSAHPDACTSVDFSPLIPGALITGGLDRSLKLWNIAGEAELDMTLPKEGAANPVPSATITLVTSRDVGAGKVFTACFNPDEALLVAVAGSSGSVKIWDALGAKGVAAVFSERIKRLTARDAQHKERKSSHLEVVGVEDDSEDDENESPATAQNGRGGQAAPAQDANMNEP